MILAYFDSHKFLPKKCPSLYKHLYAYKDQLENRGQCKYLSSGKARKINDPNYPGYPGMHHWLELDNCPSKKYLDDLNNQKILYSEIVRSPQFCLDDGKYIPEASAFYLKGDNIEFLNNYLNSFLSAWLFKTFYAGGGLGDEGYRYKKAFLINMPIPKPSSNNDYFDSFCLSNEEIDYINDQIEFFSK